MKFFYFSQICRGEFQRGGGAGGEFQSGDWGSRIEVDDKGKLTWYEIFLHWTFFVRVCNSVANISLYPDVVLSPITYKM